ncbi:MAG: MFS transporter [Aquisalimonadaceae bacterium]
MDYFRFILAHRRFLGFGVLLVGLSSVGQTFVLSLFGGHLREAFALTNASFGLIYSLATLASAVTLIWAGRLVDRVDLRRMTAVVLVGAGVGCALLAGSRGVVMLTVAFFVLRLTGQGLMVHVAQTSMARYFEAGRGKAVSIAAMGLPIAEGIMPLLMVSAAAAAGWRMTWAAAAGVMVLIMLPLALASLRGHDRRQADHEMRRQLSEQAHDQRDRRLSEVLRHPLFYTLLPAVMAPPFIITALFIHQVPLAVEQGWSLRWLAYSFTGYAVTHLLVLLATGPLVDRVGARRLVPYYLVPMILGMATLSLAVGDWVAPVYLACAGLSVGAAGTIMGSLWAELYGTTHLGSIRAVAQSCMVMTTALAPVLAGVFLDAGVMPSGLAGAFAVYAAAASLLAAIGIRSQRG